MNLLFLTYQIFLYIKDLQQDPIKHITESLEKERKRNKKNEGEIDQLKQTVATLNQSIEASKQWQASVYSQMQRMTEFNNQLSQKFNELYHEIKTLKSSSILSSQQPIISKSATKIQDAVVYGDSTSAKKLSNRRKLNTKNSTSPIKDKKNNELKHELNEKPNVEKSKIDNKKQVLKAQKEIEVTNKEAKKTTLSKASTEIKVEEPSAASDAKATDDDDLTTLNIEETLRQAAEEAMVKSGFAYDESSGMYYNWESKMYYDPNTQLYYDHENGVYYYFDQEKENYVFHSQISLADEKENNEEDSPPGSVDQLSDGEIKSGPVSPESTTTATVIDPCIRAMIVKSDSLDIGTLFIITCQGGKIGRDPTNSVCISNELISRFHASIIYEYDSKTFFIQDLKTQNGTYINDERLADPKCPSDPVEVTHRDFIQVGDTVISFHVHVGNETCFDCEPGNIQAIVEAEKQKELKEDLNVQRKQEVKSMMKKYGLSKGYIPKKLIDSVPDRAERRRKEVGSDPYQNNLKPIEKASVNKEISENNIGHKMLAKMGWKSGEGLGKSQQGIAEPVTVQVHGKSKGLGFGPTASIDSKSSRRQDILNKTKERFDKIS